MLKGIITGAEQLRTGNSVKFALTVTNAESVRKRLNTISNRCDYFTAQVHGVNLIGDATVYGVYFDYDGETVGAGVTVGEEDWQITWNEAENRLIVGMEDGFFDDETKDVTAEWHVAAKLVRGFFEIEESDEALEKDY